jgi:hypothetical protein
MFAGHHMKFKKSLMFSLRFFVSTPYLVGSVVSAALVPAAAGDARQPVEAGGEPLSETLLGFTRQQQRSAILKQEKIIKGTVS